MIDDKGRTEIPEVFSLHMAWLLLENGCAPTGKRVHVGGDGVDGHVAGPSRFLDGMVVPGAWRRGVGTGWRCEDGTDTFSRVCSMSSLNRDTVCLP